jgi:O-antigen/teichoic acid export membrane protein
LLVNKIVNLRFPQIRSEGELEKIEIGNIKEIIFGMVFQKIGSVVLSSVDSIVISAFLGLAILGRYNNYYYIISSLFGFMNVIVVSLVPSVGNRIQTESVESNYKLFRTFSFIYVWLSIWCVACLLSLYQPFMRLWIGESNMLDFDIVILLSIYFIIWKLVDPIYVFRDAAGIWKDYKFISLIAAAVNLITNIILVQYIGLRGVIVSTIVALGLIYIPFFSYPLFKRVFQSKKKYNIYIIDQLKYLLAAVFVGIATIFVCEFVPYVGILGLALKAVICVIVPNFLLLVIFFKTEDFREMVGFFEGKLGNKSQRKR